MAKKSMEVVRCENCEANEASYAVKVDGEELLLCSPCQTAYKLGQEHPDAEVVALGQEDGIDEDMFEDEGEPEKENDQAGDDN